MTEYITKEAAIQAFEWGDADVFEDYGDGYNSGFSRESIKSAIDAIPAADVAQVVHGRWIKKWDLYDKGFISAERCGMNALTAGLRLIIRTNLLR